MDYKWWNSGYYLVIAQTNAELKHKGINVFIVEKGWEGFEIGPKEEKLGIRSSDTHSLIFNDVKVPKENRIAEDGFGFKFAMKTLAGGRIGIAAQALGIAQGAYERALEYSKIRTYNYPQGRVTDHRIGLTLYDLQNIINGDIQKIIDELQLVENTEKLKESNDVF